MGTSAIRRLTPGLIFSIGVAVPGACLAGGCAQPWSLTASASVTGEVSPPSEDAGFSEVFFDATPGFACAVDGGNTQPVFGPMCTAGVPPPPISGGTLLVTHDGRTAVVCDPDRDAIYIVNLGSLTISFTVALNPGDEPGRLVEDGAGRIHVALRSGGALLTLDPSSGAVLGRRSVCPAPRGVAWDSTQDAIWVACATGELVALPSAGGPPTTSWVVERDLRDVLVNGGAVSVSEFRSAQLLALAGDGTVASRSTLPAPDTGFAPHVAWRTVPGPSGTTVSVYQEHSLSSLSTETTGGYGSGGGCGGFGGGAGSPPAAFMESFDAGGPTPTVFLPSFGPESGAIGSVLTVLGSDGKVTVNRTFDGVLPVDVAVSPDGSTYAVATPGSAFSQSGALVLGEGGLGAAVLLGLADITQVPIAVAFDPNGDILVQTRDPAILWVFPAGKGGSFLPPVAIPLSMVSRCDTGHDIFHTHAGAAIACASCHPEGGDDGHVWTLNGDLRRTPSLRGTIAGTAPYHWPGDEPNLPTLVNDVYTVRMAGQSLDDPNMTALTGWVESLPAPPAPTWINSLAAASGKALFERADVGCATCHSGAKFTNNATVDVGTGGAFQVPPLVGVGWRTPLLHDGCAQTIADRFGSCATAQHGTISSLSAEDLTNLTAYLESL